MSLENQDKRLKVVHLVEDLAVGGQEMIIAAIARGLDSSHYKVEVWCLEEGGGVADQLSADGVTVKILNLKSYHNPLNILKLASALKEAKVDLIHCHAYFANTFGRLAAKIGGVRYVVVHWHSIFSHMNIRNMLIDQFLNRLTDKVIFVSHTAQESFRREGYDMANKAVVIYNGIDHRRFVPKAGHASDKNIITVASLHPHKGHKTLFEAFQTVIKEMPDVRLRLLGEGPLRGELEQTAKELGLLSNIEFLGRRQDVETILAESDLFVLPSSREGLPLSLLEAMAAGLPAVVSQIGGIPEVIASGENGFLVPVGDAQTMARRITSLLRNQSERESFSQKARLLVEEKFTQESMLKNINQLYQNVINKG